MSHSPHGHGHDHLHPHGEPPHAHGPGGHSHAHGAGILGWLRGTFGHSHDVGDKVDESLESSERGIWALKVSLVGLGLTALFQVVIVWFSSSVALLADTIHNFADAGTSIPLWIAFALARRGAGRRFTYGYGKVEDVAGVLIVLIILSSACVAGYEAVLKILHPRPMTHLGWVAAAAVIGFLGNEAVAVFRIRVGREIGSAALVADGLHSRVDGFTSLAVLAGVVGVWAGFPIVDPLVGIAITIAILFIVRDAARAVWNRLIDGIEPAIVGEIEHAAMHVAGVKGVRQVRARWVGHKVFTDLQVTVDPDLSVRGSQEIVEAVVLELRRHVRSLGSVVVDVRPSSADS
ncbi:MAG TPA: cation diffusion facilitator family transporter [Thermoanaerobaculia bacterium]|nr:cation diffusion facilitator family transporter [Thermoanaerobaculia bacterium]